MTTMNITIVAEESGQSESIPVTADTSVKDLIEWAAALLGIDDPVLFKDGRPVAVIDPSTTTLQAAGITDGDLLVVVSSSSIQRRTRRQDPPAAARPTAAAGTGGLDFSALLANAGATSSNTTPTNATVVPKPVYYDGMSLHEAQSYNPHPQAFCTVLYDHEHLRKELNYYQPRLVADMFPNALNDSNDKMPVVERAAQIWRETMIKVTSKQRHRGEWPLFHLTKRSLFHFQFLKNLPGRHPVSSVCDEQVSRRKTNAGPVNAKSKRH
jgi:hypothetical protein